MIDDLIEKLVIIKKVEEAQNQSKKGKKFSEEKAKKMIKKRSQ